MRIAGLVVLSLLVTPVIGLGILGSFMGMFVLGAIFDAFVLIGMIAAVEALRKKCMAKWNMKTSVFILATEVPALLESLTAFLVVLYLDHIGYWKEFFDGLLEFLWSISCLICVGVIFSGTLVLCLIRHLKNKKQTDVRI